MRYGWTPYVPVALRRAQGILEMQRLRESGMEIRPIPTMKRRKIAHTFWGTGWCDHLEQFGDYENRLPRGRTYVRNGSVCHLSIEQGLIHAYVSGSDLYEIKIKIKQIPQGKWEYIRKSCTGQIGSLLELLQGRFSEEVMRVVTDRDDGLFPLPGEITFDCTCPDWAVMCKHVAAVLYGVGARLDENPALLFALRGVDHQELLDGEAMAAATATVARGKGRRRVRGDLGALFGVELDGSEEQAVKPGDTVNAQPNKKAPKATKKRAKKLAKRASKKVRKPRGKQVSRAQDRAKNQQDENQEQVDHEAKRVFLQSINGNDFLQMFASLEISLHEFSDLIGVSQATLSKWANTGRHPVRMRLKSRQLLEEAFLHPEKNRKVKLSKRQRNGLSKTLEELVIAKQKPVADTKPSTGKSRIKKTAPAIRKTTKRKGGRGAISAKKEQSASTMKKASTPSSKSIKNTSSSGAAKKPRRAKAKTPKLTGRAIASLRKRMSLSAQKFGCLIGVTGATVYNWEKKRGKINTHPDFEARLLSIFQREG